MSDEPTSEQIGQGHYLIPGGAEIIAGDERWHPRKQEWENLPGLVGCIKISELWPVRRKKPPP